MTTIASPSNPRIKEWRKLLTRKGREAAGRFLVEGPHLVADALRVSQAVESLIVEEGRPLEAGIAALVGPGASVPVTEVSASVARALSETETPQGILAVCRTEALPIATPAAGRWVLLDGVQDPGHVGTIVRTAHAAGLDGVVCGEGTADALSGKCLRAAQGSTFHLPTARGRLEEWVEALTHERTALFATGLSGESIDYREAKWGAAGFALIVGNEGAGVRREILRSCAAILRIPMKGGCESLSVPVATGVLVFRLLDQSREM